VFNNQFEMLWNNAEDIRTSSAQES
jgi:hypothetical protein